MEEQQKGFPPGTECSLCKGKCCREHGCALAPEDLLLAGRLDSKEKLLTYLQKEDNLLAIDRNGTANGFLYYIRMRHKCYTFIGVDALGECAALTKEGCSLSYEERPKGGRMLKSSPDFCCSQEYSLQEMEEDWAPYQGLLSEIFQEYEDKFSKDGTFDACDEAYFSWLRTR